MDLKEVGTMNIVLVVVLRPPPRKLPEDCGAAGRCRRFVERPNDRSAAIPGCRIAGLSSLRRLGFLVQIEIS